ncbi:UPF0187 protein [Smittium culicis]|uniref:UPF0187 protein n=1 Tax=Smittium culicis TaxID=133412 RepID=A0A1R1XLK9_9FUNG|nr:UPF0187 protein [Smittium culicis]
MVAFRTNSAYDRFWEGRKQFSSIEENITNAIRILQLSIHPKNEQERLDRAQAMKNLVAMAYSIKYYLLAKPNYLSEKMKSLVSPKILEIGGIDSSSPIDEKTWKISDKEMRSRGIFTKDSLNLPNTLAFEVTNYLEYIDRSYIVPAVYLAMYNSVSTITNAFVGCIRIQTTPIPKAYNCHLHMICTLYLLSIPFSLNGEALVTLLVVQFIVTFMLLGVLSIAEEIENPFGSDKNDLPILTYCDNLYEHLSFVLSNEKEL